MEDKKHSFHKKDLNSSDNNTSSNPDQEVSEDNKTETEKKKKKKTAQKKDQGKTEGEKQNKEKKQKEKKQEEEVGSDQSVEEKIKQEEDHIEKELTEIYTDDSGSMPDMSRFKPQKRGGIIRGLVVLIISFLFLGGVAWAGFFYFQPQSQFSESDIRFSVVGDEKAQAGEEVHYRVRYHNSQNVPLSQASLNVRYPAGFEFARSSKDPTNKDKNTWNIGAISKQSGSYIDIYGKLYGDIDEKQSLRAFMNYKPANFSSEFQKVSSLSTKIDSSPITASLSGPGQLSSGSTGEWVINLESSKIEPIKNLVVQIEPEAKFRLTEASPKTREIDKRSWEISELEDQKQISFKGLFESDEAKNPNIKVRVYYRKNNIQEEDYLLAKADKEIKINRTDVQTSIVINGATNDFSVRPGQVLNTSVKLENTGNQPMKDVKAKITFDAPSNSRQAILEKSILYWRNVSNTKDGDIEGDQIDEDTRRGTITWTGDQIPELQMLKPGDTVNIDFSLPVKDSSVIDLTTYDTSIATAVADVQYSLGDSRETVSTNKMNITINSDTRITTQDTVTKNDKDEKIHSVKWVLKNSFHKLEDIKIEADVYGDIEWMEDALNTTAGKAEFNQGSQKLTWNIEDITSGESSEVLDFAVKLKEDNPTQTNLTSKVKLKAKDTTTDQEIVTTGDEILLNKSTSTTAATN